MRSNCALTPSRQSGSIFLHSPVRLRIVLLLENIINELDKNTLNLSLKEKAAYAASLFQKTAANKNIALKLRKKK